MGAVLTLAVSAYFFIASYRLQFTYFLFIFLIPFLPKYIGFGVGGEGFAVSLKRILLMILFMWTAVSFTQNSGYIFKRISLVYQQNKILINLLLLFFILKVFSLSINTRELSQYIALFDDFLSIFFIFMLTILLVDSEETIHRLVKTIFYGYTIVLILVVVESIVKFPLLSIFASGQMQLSRDFSEGIARGGSYRATGTFTNPIVLGTYLVAMFPIVIAYLKINKYSLKFKIVYFLFFMYAIYVTGSRSAILMFAIMVYLYMFFLFGRSSQFSRFVVSVINVTITIFALSFVYIYISDLVINFGGRYDLVSDLEERSSIARAMQYGAIYDKMHEAPFFGFGRMRNFTTGFEEHLQIDNYYFWVILEVGIIGLATYFIFLFTLVKTAWSQYKLPYKNYYLLSLLISIIVMILYQILSAVKDMHIYLYIFAGLVSVMKVLQNEKCKTN